MAYDIVVSGQLCADLLPDTSNLPLSALSAAGKLFEVDALVISTGGSVSNTGLALHKLGIHVGMMTTVGDDLLGRVIIAKLKDRDPTLGEMIAVRANEASSYSIILSPENADRIILHCIGNNQNFSQSDINFDIVKQAKIFHLGYPPLLPQLYANNGQELVAIYQRIYDEGILTSLDLAHPDPNGLSGKVNWKQILEATLPYVDIFVPSIEEIVFMTRRLDYDNWNGNILQNVTRNYLRNLADELLSIGSTIVGFKLGELGFYLRTSDDIQKLTRLKSIGQSPDNWHNLDLWHPAYGVEVVGSIGAGDSAYAGFLAAILNGLDPHATMDVMCAVGACNVETLDATSGILDWDTTLERIRAGWTVSTLRLD